MVVARFVMFRLYFSTLQSLLVAGGVCPFSDCPYSDNVDATRSLLELSAKRSSISKKSTARGCGPQFLPAHFTCSSCDSTTCEGCEKVVCDISKCVGKFYSEQCWCKMRGVGKVSKHFCDEDCTGGLCNGAGLVCKSRSKACKPWWWCGRPPPKEPEEEEGDASFLQKTSSSRSAACGKQESASILNGRFEQAKAMQSQKSSSNAPKKAKDDFKFGTGSFTCDSAFMPPPDEDPTTMATSPPGFIVFDKDSCTGGYFKKTCFCYDKFEYLRGRDPETTELTCDDSCGQGPCAGRTCATVSPPPVPTPSPPPAIDPIVQDMAKEGLLRNFGQSMSVVS